MSNNTTKTKKPAKTVKYGVRVVVEYYTEIEATSDRKAKALVDEVRLEDMRSKIVSFDSMKFGR